MQYEQERISGYVDGQCTDPLYKKQKIEEKKNVSKKSPFLLAI